MDYREILKHRDIEIEKMLPEIAKILGIEKAKLKSVAGMIYIENTAEIVYKFGVPQEQDYFKFVENKYKISKDNLKVSNNFIVTRDNNTQVIEMKCKNSNKPMHIIELAYYDDKPGMKERVYELIEKSEYQKRLQNALIQKEQQEN